jgi:ABC-type phosphate transport system substrate-binding protein
MANYVALTPNAIGYAPLSYLRNKPEAKIKMLAVDGVSAGAASITDKSYKIGYTIFLMSAIEPQGELRKFTAWCLSEQAQKIVESANYVSIPRGK